MVIKGDLQYKSLREPEFSRNEMKKVRYGEMESEIHILEKTY